MFNQALRLIAAPLLPVTDVHLKISFSQVNIGILRARWAAHSSSLQFGGLSLSFTYLFFQNTKTLIKVFSRLFVAARLTG